MSKTNYVNIKTVLYDLSQLMEDRYWNESKILEWAVKGFRSLNIDEKFVEKVFKAEIDNHKVQLPTDVKFIIVVGVKDGAKVTALVPASTLLTNNLCLVNPCTTCKADYSLDENLVLTTSKDSGTLFVSYLGYPTNEFGEFLIPDDELVKEAVLNYVLWKFWLSKSLMKEEGADSRAEYFRNMWSVSSKKAISISLPDVGQMENIKNRWNHLVPRENMYRGMFITLNESENVNF